MCTAERLEVISAEMSVREDEGGVEIDDEDGVVELADAEMEKLELPTATDDEVVKGPVPPTELFHGMLQAAQESVQVEVLVLRLAADVPPVLLPVVV